jgi:hypothetical protein
MAILQIIPLWQCDAFNYFTNSELAVLSSCFKSMA